MATISDDFNRADGSLGANWSQIANDSIDIFSNRVRSDSGFPTFVVHATPTDTNVCHNQLTFDTTDTTGTVMGEPSLFLCGDGTWAYPRANGYQLWIDLAGNLNVYRNATQIGTTQTTPVVPNSGTHVVKLSVDSGGIVRVHVGAVEEFSYTDPSPLTNKRHGFGWNSISFSGEYAYADTYEAADDGGGGATTLVVANALHAHSAAAPTLTVDPITLTVANALHAHAAQQPTITVDPITLVAANASHAHAAGAPTITVDPIDLVAASATHAHIAQQVALTVGTVTLAVDDTAHAHAATHLTLGGEQTLVVADAHHAHSAGTVVIGGKGFRAEITFLTGILAEDPA